MIHRNENLSAIPSFATHEPGGMVFRNFHQLAGNAAKEDIVEPSHAFFPYRAGIVMSGIGLSNDVTGYFHDLASILCLDVASLKTPSLENLCGLFYIPLRAFSLPGMLKRNVMSKSNR